MNDYNELIERLTGSAGDQECLYSDAKNAIEALQSRIGELCAARIAYASEFAPDAEGLPDTGSIHANIRAMKARVAELESRLEISPLHNVDGIMARDATIKLQDDRIFELERRLREAEDKKTAGGGSPLKRLQTLSSRVAELEAERAEREKQEPAAWCCDGEDGREYNGTPQMSNGRTGTPLYAAPPVTAQAEGYVTALRYIAWEAAGYMDCVHAAKQAIGETGALPPPPKIQPAEAGG